MQAAKICLDLASLYQVPCSQCCVQAWRRSLQQFATTFFLLVLELRGQAQIFSLFSFFSWQLKDLVSPLGHPYS